MVRHLTILLLLILTATALPAAQLEPHRRILETASAYLINQHGGASESLKVTPGKLDKRLRLKKCTGPLEAFAPGKRRSGTRQTVGVRCNGESSWTLYVTVNVAQSKPILVANRALERGARIGQNDFRLETRVVSGLHRGFIEDPAKVIGRALKRSVRKDTALVPGQLQPQLDVRRGAAVTILGRSGPVEIRMTGRAHADGSRGDRIKVTNSSSQREIEAVVVAPDTVEVSM